MYDPHSGDERVALRILFVGNSFVHYNDGIEKVVGDLLEERLGKAVRTARYAPGGYNWSQHLHDAHDKEHVLYRLLGPGDLAGWDYVVFQEQSQAPGMGREVVQASAAAFRGLVSLAKARGAVTVLLMTWAYRDGDPTHPDVFPTFAAMQDSVSAGYWHLAEDIRTHLNTPAFVAPAGLAWKRVRQLQEVARLGSRRPQAAAGPGETLPYGSATFGKLYSSDGIHPSPPGTYLAACVTAAALTGCRMEGATSHPESLGTRWPAFLQEVADWAVHEGIPEGAPPYPWASARACALPR
eukprot:jgi/Botrbrau1/12899/Bobra.0299s0015.2